MRNTSLTAPLAIPYVGLFFSVLFWTLFPFSPVLATCCKCHGTDPATNICLHTNDSDCGKALASTPNPKLKGFSCEAGNLGDAQCKMIKDGGICGEMAEMGLYEPPGPAGTEQATELQPKEKYSTVIPQLNVDVGAQFPAQIEEVQGIVRFPFIAQYIAAVYKYALGVSVIAAAVMFVYGGFLYIIGSTAKSVTSGKTYILDAVAGLILVLASYVLLNAINPDTLNPQAVALRNIKRDEFALSYFKFGGGATGEDSSPSMVSAMAQAIISALKETGGNKVMPSEAPAAPKPAPGGAPSGGAPSGGAPSGGAPSATGTPSGAAATIGCSELTLKKGKIGTWTSMGSVCGNKNNWKGMAEVLDHWSKVGPQGSMYCRYCVSGKNGKIAPLSKGTINNNNAAGWFFNAIVKERKWLTDDIKNNCVIKPKDPAAEPTLADSIGKVAKDKREACVQAVYATYTDTAVKTMKCFDLYGSDCTGLTTNFSQCIHARYAVCPKDSESATLPAGTKIPICPPDRFLVNSKNELLQHANEIKPGARITIFNIGHDILYTGRLGLSFEVMEAGGGCSGAPPVTVAPGFFGGDSTSFLRGVNMTATLDRYLKNCVPGAMDAPVQFVVTNLVGTSD